MDMVNLLPVQILLTQSFRDHGAGRLEGFSQGFYHILVKGFRLAFSAETNPFGSVDGRLELTFQVAGGHQHQARKSIRLVLKPAVVGFVRLILEPLPFAGGACGTTGLAVMYAPLRIERRGRRNAKNGTSAPHE